MNGKKLQHLLCFLNSQTKRQFDEKLCEPTKKTLSSLSSISSSFRRRLRPEQTKVFAVSLNSSSSNIRFQKPFWNDCEILSRCWTLSVGTENGWFAFTMSITFYLSSQLLYSNFYRFRSEIDLDYDIIIVTDLFFVDFQRFFWYDVFKHSVEIWKMFLRFYVKSIWNHWKLCILITKRMMWISISRKISTQCQARLAKVPPWQKGQKDLLPSPASDDFIDKLGNWVGRHLILLEKEPRRDSYANTIEIFVSATAFSIWRMAQEMYSVEIS